MCHSKSSANTAGLRNNKTRLWSSGLGQNYRGHFTLVRLFRAWRLDKVPCRVDTTPPSPSHQMWPGGVHHDTVHHSADKLENDRSTANTQETWGGNRYFIILWVSSVTAISKTGLHNKEISLGELFRLAWGGGGQTEETFTSLLLVDHWPLITFWVFF